MKESLTIYYKWMEDSRQELIRLLEQYIKSFEDEKENV